MATFGTGKRPCANDEPYANLVKRPRLDNTDENERLGHDDYTVGWICALPIEMTAAEAMLDQIHEPLPTQPHDSNTYVLGRISDHNVVMTCLPAGHYGTNNAAIVANNMRRTFPSIDKSFMVGIGGGAPDIVDVRLGDIVVSHQVVQYDFGKTLTNGRFHPTSLPTRPPQSLLTAVSRLQAHHNSKPSQVTSILTKISQDNAHMLGYAHPGLPDRLFHDTYDHVQPNEDCDQCSVSELASRPPRQDSGPRIHYGKIASGNQVIKDGATRKRLATDLGVVCFEMEAAGLMDNLPSLIVRGICDYADSHKNDKWQRYAAAIAAAYTKELLSLMPGRNLSTDHPRTDSFSRARSLQAIRSSVLESLRFDQIDARHATIKAAHTHTCKWFLDHPDYTGWLDPQRYSEHHGFLWISGKPGAGKSTLMKYAYTEACTRYKKAPAAAIISFFFNARGNELERSTNGMYRSLLIQLLSSFPDIGQILDQVAEAHGEAESISWETHALQALFSKAVAQIGKRTLTCFIDALDECDQNEVQAMVEDFEALGAVASNNALKLYICFSSRHYPHIRIEDGLRVVLEDQPGHGQDLEKYVRSKLRAGKGKAGQSVISGILEKAAGVFMWVVLVVDILNKEFQKGRIFAVKKRLAELPPKLSDLFKDILTRDNENMDDLLLCIQWILYARRPLTCEEFYFALVSGLDPSLDNLVKWDQEMITTEDMRRFLLSSSKGLAEVTKSKKDATIQFIHESVRDFLLKDNGIRDLWPELAIGFEDYSHQQLKRCCENYTAIDDSELLDLLERPGKASSQSVKDLQRDISHAYPFMEYATSHLLYHADASGDLSSEDIFIQKFDFRTWLVYYNFFQKFDTRRYTSEPTLVYILAEYGYTRLLTSAIRGGAVPQMTKEKYKHPLFAALINGHSTAAHLLQDTNRVSLQEYTAGNKQKLHTLPWAAANGYTDVVAYLMTADGFNMNSMDAKGRVPLCCASANGHLDTVNLLLEEFNTKGRSQDASVDEAVSLAVIGGHASVVERLLKIDRIEINSRDDNGRILLSHAAERGREEIIRLLLAESSIEINSRDNNGRTPLSYAVSPQWYYSKGSMKETVVKLLLAESSIEINSRDNKGRTPLSHAAEWGLEGVIRLLLATNSIEINSRDDNGRTPLSHAAEWGREGVIRLLLATNSIEIDSRDDNGRTPLSHAAEWGREGIIRLLLAESSIEINSRDNNGHTPLSYAVSSGWYYSKGNMKEAAVKLLLAESSIEINSRDNNGRTPLSHAAGLVYGKAAVKLLLEKGQVDVGSKDNHGLTPIMWAMKTGNSDIASLLRCKNI